MKGKEKGPVALRMGDPKVCGNANHVLHATSQSDASYITVTIVDQK